LYTISLSIAKQIYLTILHYHTARKTFIANAVCNSIITPTLLIHIYILFLSIMLFEAGDLVSNPLFWKGIVIESFGDKVVVNRNNKLFWLRTVDRNIFEADMEARVTKKKKIGKDYDEQYFDMHREDDLLTNDQI